MAKTLRMAKAGKRKKSVHALFKLFLIVLTLFCVGAFLNQELSIYQIKQEQAATQKRLEELKKQRAELEAERRRLDDPKYIERIARDEYNMVGPNEVPMFVVDNNKK